jgi:hypothetical protein
MPRRGAAGAEAGRSRGPTRGGGERPRPSSWTRSMPPPRSPGQAERASAGSALAAAGRGTCPRSASDRRTSSGMSQVATVGSAEREATTRSRALSRSQSRFGMESISIVPAGTLEQGSGRAERGLAPGPRALGLASGRSQHRWQSRPGGPPARPPPTGPQVGAGAAPGGWSRALLDRRRAATRPGTPGRHPGPSRSRTSEPGVRSRPPGGRPWPRPPRRSRATAPDGPCGPGPRPRPGFWP